MINADDPGTPSRPVDTTAPTPAALGRVTSGEVVDMDEFSGTSRPLWLLLHGTPLTPAVWSGVADRLRVFGDVCCPVVDVGGGAATAADIARAILRQWTADQPVHVVGHSFGGQVAIEIALLAPQLTRTLTVLCSRDTPYPGFSAAAARLRSGQVTDVEAALRRWFTAAELATDAPVVGYARKCLEQADPDRWAAALDLIAAYDASADVPRIAARTTLLAAEFDPVSTPGVMADLAGRLQRGTLHVLPGAAHLSPFLDPDALADALRGAAGFTDRRPARSGN